MAELIGHRGSPWQAPENTLPSFTAALAAGLDGIETDVQRTSDGVLVLHHDTVLANGTFISALVSADLHDVAPHVPLLDDLVPLLHDYPAARVNLELKVAAPFADTRVDDLCRALSTWPADVLARVWVSTFDPLLLLALEERMAEVGVSVPLAFLVHSRAALRLVPALQVSAVHPHHALIDRAAVARWHEQGLAVYTWSINELGLARSLLAAGVDGLIGDLPDLLLRARAGR